MCFGPDSRPPVAPMEGAAIDARRLVLEAADGDRVAAFEARAGEQPSRAAVLVLPDVRGLVAYYEELALRFAEAGCDALVIDYFGRSAGPERDRGDSFDFRSHVEQTTWDGLRADVSAAATHLASAADRARRLFSVGFCFGGRLSFLCATLREPAFAGVVGFYGVVAGPGRAGMPAPLDEARAGRIAAPVLGLFGGADEAIPGESVDAFGAALDAAGVEHELVSYPGAPHSFFDRKADEHADASADAWRRVLSFIERHTTVRAAPTG